MKIEAKISEEEAASEQGDASIPYIDPGDEAGFGEGWGENEDADPASDEKAQDENPSEEKKEPGEDADEGEKVKTAKVDATPPKESEKKVSKPPEDPGPSEATGQSDPPEKSSESPKDVTELRDQILTLQKSQAKQESDLKAEINRLKQGIARPPPAEVVKVPDGSETDIDAVLKPIEGIEPEVAKVLKETVGVLRKEISGLRAATVETATRSAQLQVQTADQRFDDAVAVEHPEWKTTAESAEFKAWLGKQAGYVKKAAEESSEPNDAIELLSRYKSATEKPKAQETIPTPEETVKQEQEAAEKKKKEEARKKRLESSTGVPAGGSTPDAESLEKTNGDFDSGWKKAADEDDF